MIAMFVRSIACIARRLQLVAVAPDTIAMKAASANKVDIELALLALRLAPLPGESGRVKFYH